MKRSILLILGLYLFSLSGLAAQIHFCDGTFESISIGYNSSPECCCDDDNACKNCCKNEQFKPSVSHHFSAKQQIVHTINIILDKEYTLSESYLTQPFVGNACLPFCFKDNGVPVFIKNCVYRL